MKVRGKYEILDVLSIGLLNGIYKGNSLQGYVTDFSSTVAKENL
jgi:hypothetical protein